MECFLCSGTRRVKVINTLHPTDLSLIDAEKKGMEIVEEDCPLCKLAEKLQK